VQTTPPRAGSPVAPLLELVRVNKRYRLGDVMVDGLVDVSLSVQEGVFLAISGPSGSGKSTLLNLIGLIDTPSSGVIKIDGRDLSAETPDALAPLRARTIGFIFQTFNLLPVLTAYENVEYPLLQFPELEPARRQQRIRRALEVVGLGDKMNNRPNQLSGGQRQRVAIARALVTRPRIVLADEPTANLDHNTGTEVLMLMKSINRTFGTTFIFSTHDKRVLRAADRIVRISDGRIEALGKREAKTWTMVKIPRSETPNGVAPTVEVS
jgi:putative ABC transport system ATP-binding protein